MKRGQWCYTYCPLLSHGGYMTGRIYKADALLPEFRGDEPLEDTVRRICDYLFLQREELGYELEKLGVKINRRDTAAQDTPVTPDEPDTPETPATPED